MQAVILAGGFGTRLRSVLADVPKPMAPIHGKPFLAYLLDYLKSQGVTEIVISVHYLREQIQDYFGQCYQEMPVQYVVEDEPLGTGGAIQKVFSTLKIAQPVFVLNGDTFLKLDYQEMFSQHQENQPLITMALRKIADCSRYGTVEVDNNIVTEFKEQGDNTAGLINAGVYVIHPDLFSSFSLPESFSFERDFLFPNASAIKPEAYVVDEYFIDIGVPADYQRAGREFVLD